MFLPRKLRTRDASKLHVQLSLALLGMLLMFMIGINRTEAFESCVTVSVLIHYFTLVAVMWMGAEALLMFQKLVIVFIQITTRYLIILSLVCWCKYFLITFYHSVLHHLFHQYSGAPITSDNFSSKWSKINGILPRRTNIHVSKCRN